MSLVIQPAPDRPLSEQPRIIILSGNVDEILHAKFIEALAQLEHISKEPIYLHITSFGGSAYEMFGIVDLIRNAKSPIHTICTGKSMSAAVPLLAMGYKGERKIGKYSTIMLHEVSNMSWGKFYELQNEVIETKRIQENYLEILCEHTKIPKNKFLKIFESHKDTYLTAKDAIELKVADKIF